MVFVGLSSMTCGLVHLRTGPRVVRPNQSFETLCCDCDCEWSECARFPGSIAGMAGDSDFAGGVNGSQGWQAHVSPGAFRRDSGSNLGRRFAPQVWQTVHAGRDQCPCPSHSGVPSSGILVRAVAHHATMSYAAQLGPADPSRQPLFLCKDWSPGGLDFLLVNFAVSQPASFPGRKAPLFLDPATRLSSLLKAGPRLIPSGCWRRQVPGSNPRLPVLLGRDLTA